MCLSENNFEHKRVHVVFRTFWIKLNWSPILLAFKKKCQMGTMLCCETLKLSELLGLLYYWKTSGCPPLSNGDLLSILIHPIQPKPHPWLDVIAYSMNLIWNIIRSIITTFFLSIIWKIKYCFHMHERSMSQNLSSQGSGDPLRLSVTSSSRLYLLFWLKRCLPPSAPTDIIMICVLEV